MTIRLRKAVRQFPLIVNPTSISLDVDSFDTVHKFGYNDAVGTAPEPICVSGVYQTPIALTSLEILSDDADDTSAGSGAQQVQVWGIGAGWTEATTTVLMNGTGAVVLDTQFYRIWRIKVIRSGTYATQAAASQQGTITLRVVSAGATWAQLNELVSEFGVSQSQIGVYTIPSGKVGYIAKASATVDSVRTASLYLFARENADDVVTPFTGIMQIKHQADGITGAYSLPIDSPLKPLVGPCDVGFMGKVDTTAASISVDFELFLFNINADDR